MTPPTRRALIVAIGLSGVLASAACSPSSGTGGSGDATTLTVWSWRVEDQAAYRKIFDVYEKAHPGVKVRVRAFKATEYNKVLQTGLAGSDGPDVAQVRSYGALQPTVASGSLVPLDGQVHLDGWDANAVASAKGKADGKTYAVPLALQTVQMYYNKGLFAKHRVALPTTWPAFVSAADTLKAAGVVPVAVGAKDDWTLPIVHEVLAASRFGGKAFRADVLSGRTSFTDKDFVASIALVKSLQRYLPDDVNGIAVTDAQTMFTAEKAAMIPGGSFDLSTLQKGNPQMEIGVFQMPVAPGSPAGSGPTTAGWSDGNFAVSAKSPRRAAALALVTWMTTKEFGQLVADEVKQISAVPGVTYSDPLLTQMAANYAKDGSPYLLLTDFRYGSPSGGELFGKGMQELFLGSKAPAQVAADLDSGLKAWFKPGS